VKADPQKRAIRKNAATTRPTAGPGFAFEDLVAADLLSQFLLDMPIDGIGVPGDRLLSQAAAAGWSIDDLVCVGSGENDIEHRLSLSCKSNVQVTNTGWPADFIRAAWQQWRKEDPYQRSTVMEHFWRCGQSAANSSPPVNSLFRGSLQGKSRNCGSEQRPPD